MIKLSELVKNPSGLDSLSNYTGEIPDDEWYCVLTRSRDSSVLEESNFESCLEILGGEGEDVKIDRFRHWACGWWEALSVKENTPKFDIAEQINATLSDYPVLCDDDYYSRLQDTAENIFDFRDGVEWAREQLDLKNLGIENLWDLSESEMIDLIEKHYCGGLVDFCNVV